jgi:methionyl-tRNA formyltransferase
VRVLFWGTSTFGAPSLGALVGEGFEVVGVVTQPDRPVGRHRSSITAPPIKEIAAEIAALEPEISVVVAYGHILHRETIVMPPLGTVNVHASLLPKLRGAAPIQAAIRDGLIESGVTIMRMVEELDAGPIILQARTPIAEDETYGELHLRLSELGALALVEALTLLSLGKTSERPQDASAATYAPKIDRAATRVNFQEGCGVVARHIRAFDPRPGAYTTHRGTDVKLFGAVATEEAGDEGAMRYGQVLAVDATGMLVATGDGAVRVGYVQPAGKRRMTAQAWSRGRGVQVGDRLGE